jgi:hypothetical protein
MGEPIVLSFATQVLEASIIAKNPTSVNATCTNTEDQVAINLGMLHSGEEFTIQVVCEGNPDWPHPSYRLDGNPRVEVIRPAYPSKSPE